MPLLTRREEIELEIQQHFEMLKILDPKKPEHKQPILRLMAAVRHLYEDLDRLH